MLSRAITRPAAVTIGDIAAAAYTVSTDFPESDGTLEWNKTILVIAEVSAGGKRGLGYTYADESAVGLIQRLLAETLSGGDAMAVTSLYMQMWQRVRNLGRPGLCSAAISAVDCALWDLKAQLLNLPLVTLLGQTHDAAPIYGSGGFTNYSNEQLLKQLRDWVEQGISRVKIKIGRDATVDRQRVAAARKAIGENVGLFVDANGAYSRKQALAQANAFEEVKVSWFEEPVSSDDLEGLRFIRDRAPAAMDIAAGEYGYDVDYFRRMLDVGAVDVLQADATRCCGFTGFLQAAPLCDAHHVQLSSHCAPALHLHIGCATPAIRHAEYFHDHVRIERMLFDGVVEPIEGALKPDLSQPGLGLTLKRADTQKFAI